MDHKILQLFDNVGIGKKIVFIMKGTQSFGVECNYLMEADEAHSEGRESTRLFLNPHPTVKDNFETGLMKLFSISCK